MDFCSDQVHIWCIYTDSVNDWVLSALEISDLERDKISKYIFLKDRRQCAITRVAVRRILSRYLDLPAEEINFQFLKHSKPQISKIQNIGNIQFNISHTEGLVVVAVTKNGDIGIDVEKVDRINNLEGLVETSCAQKEIEYIYSDSDKLDPIKFYQIWTLKEAVAKAIGKGLFLEFKKILFNLQWDNNNNALISFVSDEIPSDKYWKFICKKFGSDYLMSAAVEKKNVQKCSFTIIHSPLNLMMTILFHSYQNQVLQKIFKANVN